MNQKDDDKSVCNYNEEPLNCEDGNNVIDGGDDCDEEVVSEDDKDAEGADSSDDKEEDVDSEDDRGFACTKPPSRAVFTKIIFQRGELFLGYSYRENKTCFKSSM